ncbi:hypothetical protein AB0E96_38505, partial [Kitasatospora sp. NPDC036755]
MHGNGDHNGHTTGPCGGGAAPRAAAGSSQRAAACGPGSTRTAARPGAGLHQRLTTAFGAAPGRNGTPGPASSAVSASCAASGGAAAGRHSTGLGGAAGRN